MKYLKIKYLPAILLVTWAICMTSCDRDPIQNEAQAEIESPGIEFNESLIDWAEVITVNIPEGMTEEEGVEWAKLLTEEKIDEIGEVGVYDESNILEARSCGGYNLIANYYYVTCSSCGTGYQHYRYRIYQQNCSNGTVNYWRLNESFCRSYC